MDAELSRWIGTVIVGGLIGWIVAIFTKTDTTIQLLASIVIGIIGSFIAASAVIIMGGSKAASASDLPPIFFAALVGAVVLLSIVRFLASFRKMQV